MRFSLTMSLLLLICLPYSGFAEILPKNLPSQETGTVRGIVVDAQSGEPVAYAYLHLEEINRTTITDREGRFQLRNVPGGAYTLLIHRIGYHSASHRISVNGEEPEELRLELVPATLSGEEVRVIAGREGTVGANLEHASSKITGEQLRRDLGTTLSMTLDHQPGISERSMGMAPGRPVIRGLGNERVVILEDGQQTGDVSWTSGDHAVSLDPTSATEIEIARGPAALEHGSGAIGGIINVVRNQIPTSVPTRTTGTLSLQGMSANRSGMASGSVSLPVSEDLALNLDLSGRTGTDVRTPVGQITNSYLQTTNSGFGGSYIRSWGYAGLSGNIYYSEYGIPPDPDGGHAEGVDIEMLKMQTEGRTEVLLRGSHFSTLEVRTSYIRYEHAEIEANGSLGTRYEMDTLTGSVKLRNSGWGPFDRGVAGISGEWIDYSVFGSRTPASNAFRSALFFIQETDIGPLHLEAGLRLNQTLNRPQQERTSYIGHVRQRSFTGLESSLSAIYNLGYGLHAGTTLIHSWRAPSLEELYSEGPHLANYSFEVGNPDLEVERGLGTELFLSYNNGALELELAGYYNRFNNYILSQDTGRPSAPRADLREFQYVGTRASIYGAELAGQLALGRRVSLHGNLSWTLGDRRVTEEEKENTGLTRSEQPLPLMPPADGRVGLRYASGGFSADSRVRFAAPQRRLPECPESADLSLPYPCETETDGYMLIDLNVQYRFSWGSTMQTLSLNGLNLLNREYYNHLSLIKEIFPEPGRSINLLYRVYF